MVKLHSVRMVFIDAFISTHMHTLCGPGSSVGIATDYGLGGPGSNPGGEEISARPDQPWGPPSLL